MSQRQIAQEAQEEMWQAAQQAGSGDEPTPRQVELIARRLCGLANEPWPTSCDQASRLIARLGRQGP